ncbi:hypothetical protein MJG53_010867 [Ovis ammon polii x Ovis aries]|uniref:Uncharacterized protein n=2 Tax=Ovis TaxID=9935 RepID=A0A836A6E8_SHEEP|nr:hypothetical protein JEQ12_003467 [Ovis aries]KAI4562867.1 hypothetical protein MJT46_010476 [Ovis ammon polii x Ovis aries]KAI4578012.1 hypothetical protein MJG53_010867 [Ovis ammon polii x Ovis aries]
MSPKPPDTTQEDAFREEHSPETRTQTQGYLQAPDDDVLPKPESDWFLKRRVGGRSDAEPGPKSSRELRSLERDGSGAGRSWP